MYCMRLSKSPCACVCNLTFCQCMIHWIHTSHICVYVNYDLKGRKNKESIRLGEPNEQQGIIRRRQSTCKVGLLNLKILNVKCPLSEYFYSVYSYICQFYRAMLALCMQSRAIVYHKALAPEDYNQPAISGFDYRALPAPIYPDDNT